MAIDFSKFVMSRLDTLHLKQKKTNVRVPYKFDLLYAEPINENKATATQGTNVLNIYIQPRRTI